MRYDLLKILLVDDNHYMRVLLAEILRAIGVKDIWEASDGAEGLQMMRDHAVDIVMTDLSMQPLDGIDFVRLLRNSPDSPNQMTPVVMITGHSTFARKLYRSTRCWIAAFGHRVFTTSAPPVEKRSANLSSRVNVA